MPIVTVSPKGEDRLKARSRAVVGPLATAALVVVGFCVTFSGCGGDNAAEPESGGAPRTDTALPPDAGTAGGGGETRAESLPDALRSVIATMLVETGADLSPAEVKAETDARYQEGVESFRRFYPEFLDETAPNHSAPAEERIEAGRGAFEGVFGRVHVRDVPIMEWLLAKDKADELDPVRAELLAQLLQGRFLITPLPRDREESRWRRSLASREKTLFPHNPSKKFVSLNAEEVQSKSAVEKIARGLDRMHQKSAAASTVDRTKDDQPLGLSWRVHILPFLKQQELYEQFKLDEPWDNAHNRQLVEKMPDLYRTPGLTQPGMTAIHVFVGEQTPFGDQGPRKPALSREEKKHTLACLVAGPETATEWTRPGGIPFDPEAGMGVLGTLSLNVGVPVAFMDGVAMFFPPDMPADAFSPFVIRQEGSSVDRYLAWASGVPEVEPPWPFGTRGKPQGPQDKFKRLGTALHAYHTTHKVFPSASANAAGQSGLSWRVHILPFLEEQELYEQFKIDEPWDSPHNLELVDRMPEAYRVSGVAENKTVYHMFVGPDTPFGQERGLDFAKVTDGTSNTIMAVIGTPETAVQWTKPGGIDFDPANPFRGLAQMDGAYPLLLMDGFPYLLSGETGPEEMGKLVTHRDGRSANAPRKPWR